jgi:CheY-like chemotaxis protein
MCTTVLVVEDDEDLRSAVIELLQAAGYEVEGAENGAVALERVATRRPRLILLDVRMPVMNGREFTRVFRERYGRVPIVAWTAAPDPRRIATELEADGCLSKPFDIDELYAVVRRQLGEP